MEPVKAIEMKGISKAFGSVMANEDVSLTVYNGEIHALLGENGAGKSTLMNMLSGIYTPDSGSISILGEQIRLTSPKDSIGLGIGMIHQHFKLVDVMTAKENIMLGGKGRFFISASEIAKEIRAICDRYGLDIDPDKKVYDMSVGEKQTLEIIKVLYRGARILIMDEPTAVLTPQEIARLFEIMRSMRAQGCAIIIITHKLGEVMEISDRVTVLRKGRSLDTVNTAEVEMNTLIEMMVGKTVDLEISKENRAHKEKLLEIDHLTIENAEHKNALESVSFSLYGGEILGIAGVAGSGQKEICEAIAGLTPIKKGRIFFENENIIGKSPRDIIKMGIRMGFIPEDRLGMGLVGNMDITDNIMLKDYHAQPGIFLNRAKSAKKAQEIVGKLDILTPGVKNYPVKKLSGGNIQKVLLGREIDSNPKVLITAYPVRGLDIGASYKIYDLLNEQKKNGVGVLFIGEDLDVLMQLCDRVMVFCGGEVMGTVDPTQVTKEEIGLMMAGERIS